MILQINNLHKSFGSNEILKGVSFSVDEGEVLGVIGSSGSGKSTILRCINYLEKPNSGRVRFAEREFDIETAGKEDIRYMRSHTAMVFQQFNLFKYKTALENVMEGLVVVQKRPKKEAEGIARELLVRVGLRSRIDYYPRELSGGQQQRVAIARALALNPKLIMLDEPTSALDPEMIGEVLDVIRNVAKSGRTMIIVSHEMNFINDIANHVLFLDGGAVVEEGAPNVLFGSPRQERTRQFLQRANIISDYTI
jgi:L-cystine transport system ATP-binding protein